MIFWQKSSCFQRQTLAKSTEINAQNKIGEIQYSHFLKTFFFKRSFRFTTKLRGRYRELPYTPFPHIRIAFLIINITHKNDTFFFFFTKDEPALTHHNHPKYIVYISVHSWCCTFYGSGQIYNAIYAILYIIQSIFTA